MSGRIPIIESALQAGEATSETGKTKSAGKPPCSTIETAILVAVAVFCFHFAYGLSESAFAQLFIIGYAAALVQLTQVRSLRMAFWIGLLVGFLCYAPQLTFFWSVFGVAATALWLILAFWLALFVALINATQRRWGAKVAAVSLPFVWTGLEYFRSELYHLKFSWLNLAYALPAWETNLLPWLGMYGVGFLIMTLLSMGLLVPSGPKQGVVVLIPVAILLLSGFASPKPETVPKDPAVQIAGVQLEFASPREIVAALDRVVALHPQAQLVVLSEYTLDGPVPDTLQAWCHQTGRYLVVGGKDPVGGYSYYDTGYVVSPAGEVVFRQGKSVPIPFFNDGLPAPHQAVWDSPWGRIGFCVCFDLSFTRVTDELIRQGAQILVVPSMDLMGWGAQEHESNARVTPVRAAEYGVPIFRVTSSGISQAVNPQGQTLASKGFPGQGEIIEASFRLPAKGTLPIDRWLGPLSVGVTALLWAWLIISRWFGRSENQKRAAKT